jgi:hypothetical protein
MRAELTMIPEENLGLVILANMNDTPFPKALALKIIDTYLGVPQRDWASDFLEMEKELKGQVEAELRKTEEARVRGTTPSLPLEKYLGIYRNDAYGDVKIKQEDGSLIICCSPRLKGDLEYWHYDTFSTTWRDSILGRSFITFTLDAWGKMEVMKVQGIGDFRYTQDIA